MDKLLEVMKENVKVEELTPAQLAYVGDSVFEIYVRAKITLEANRKIKELNKEALNYVKAGMQAESYKDIAEYLTEEEEEIYKRCRNHKGTISSRSATASDYRMATGLEGLLGYLLLTGQMERLDELMKIIFEKKDERLNNN
ncbi:MAG: ribonuclease III [Clostridia bacterium]|nr:ribonuclease III [Clostridia bacterium]